MNFEELTTPRLRLRKLTQEVYDYVFAKYNDKELITFLGVESAKDLQAEKDRYASNLSSYNKTFVYFQLIHKENGKIIGSCGFHTIYPSHDRAEIGYSLHTDDYKRQGLMSEAIVAVIDFGFNDLKLHRIEAFVGHSNPPSVRLMENMNFTLEGNMREHYLRDGIYEDSFVYSLLRSEYKS
jgi:ribosomal-protein-alanine N-acetyltransferase